METGSAPPSTTIVETAPSVRLVSARSQRPRSMYDLTLKELEEHVDQLGAPRYRARQIYNWLYSQLVSEYDSMNNVPAELRQKLSADLPIAVMTPIREIAT